MLQTKIIFIAILLSSFASNYFLFNKVQTLKVDKQMQAALIDKNEQQKAHLAKTIGNLQSDKRQAQKESDALIKQFDTGKQQLQQRVNQLKKELAHETCNDTVINYPADWLSSY